MERKDLQQKKLPNSPGVYYFLGNLQSNIWKYTLILITNKRVFAAILGAYYLTIPEVTPFWIGIFLLVGNGASLIFDIPSSYIADRIGHKRSIILSRVFMVASTSLFLFANNIWVLAMASFLMSMAQAFISGVGTAFMHETIRALNREQEYRTIMGKVTSIGFFLPALFAALIPFTVTYSYTIPFVFGLVLDIIGLVTAVSLVVPKVQIDTAVPVEIKNFSQIIRAGRELKYFRIAIFSGVAGAMLFSIDGFRGPYQIFLSIPVMWFGIFFGLGRVLSSVLLAFSGKIHALIGDIYSYQRFILIVYGSLLLLLGITSNPWIIVVVFILDNGLRYGLSQIEIGYELEIIGKQKYKATLLSMSNQIQNVLAMCIVGLMGISIEYIGYQTTFVVISIVFILFLLPYHLWIVRAAKRNYGT
jgi:MFS family permease